MTRDDFDEFDRAYSAAWAFHKEPTATMIAEAFRVLSGFPLRAVLAGIDAHSRDSQRGQYGPKPADIVFQIERFAPELERPTADEAWAMCPHSEAETVVWTTEIAEAFGLACGVDESDRIGRRMAFKGAYERLVGRAKANFEPVRWVVSVGHDATAREAVISDSVRLGRLSRDQAAEYLTHSPAPNGFAQLEHAARQAAPEQRDQALTALRGLRALLDRAIGEDEAAVEADRKRRAAAANALVDRLEQEAARRAAQEAARQAAGNT